MQDFSLRGGEVQYASKRVSVLINQNGTSVPFYFIILFRFDPCA